MKKCKLLILLLGFLSLPCCDGYPVSFTQKAEVTIPALPAKASRPTRKITTRLEEFSEKFFKIQIAGKKLIQEHDLSEAAILSTYLKKLQLNIKPNSKGQSLAFIEAVEFYAEADNLPTILIAHLDTITSGNTATLVINKEDLKPYLISDSVTIFAKVKGNLPDQETKIEAVFDLEVNIDVALSCQGAN